MPDSLRLITFDYSGFRKALGRQSELFNREFEECRIEIDFVASYEELYEVMIGKGGVFSEKYDIFLCLTDWIPKIVEAGGLAPLDDYVDEDPPETWPNIWPESLLRLQKDAKGKMYGFPYHDGPMILMYRKDLFEDGDERRIYKQKYGAPLRIPRTWSDFLKTAKFFNRPKEDLYGTVIGAYPDGHMNVYDFLLHLQTRGGRFSDEGFSPTFNSPEGLEALQFYVDLIWKHRIAPEESLDFNCHEAGQYYLDGNAAIIWQWSNFACIAEMAEHSKVVGRTGYALVPRGDGVVGQHKSVNVYWVLTIPIGCKQKAVAYRFLRTLASKLGDKYTAMAGAIGTRLSTWRDEEMQAKWPFYGLMEEIHRNAASPPPIPEFPEINRVLNGMVDDAVRLRRPVSAALGEAHLRVREIVESRGYLE